MFTSCTCSLFSDHIQRQWALRTHLEHSDSDQTDSLAILVILLQFFRIIKLEIASADFVGCSVYCVDVHETLAV